MGCGVDDAQFAKISLADFVGGGFGAVNPWDRVEAQILRLSDPDAVPSLDRDLTRPNRRKFARAAR